MSTREIKSIIKQIKAKKLYHNEISDEYKDNLDIIKAERDAGSRFVDRVCFDVISQKYFVHETIVYFNRSSEDEYEIENKVQFDDFDSFYEYLDGNIYDNACFYQLDASKLNEQVSVDKLQSKVSFIDYTIDDYEAMDTLEKERQYTERENVKKQIKAWVKRFNKCDTYDKFSNMVKKYYKSVLSTIYEIDVDFFFWQYIFFDLHDFNRFEIIMQYMSTGKDPRAYMIEALCHVYDPDEVLKHYKCSWGVEKTRKNNKKKLKDYIEYIKQNDAQPQKTSVYFDKKTHYYCESKNYDGFFSTVCRYFETIEELLEYRNYDLTNTDLSADLELNIDLTKCKLDETSILPYRYYNDINYTMKKWYDGERFRVSQTWSNANNVIIKQYAHKFDYFFDFVAFLQGDLSGADLVLCDGLLNLQSVDGLNLINTKIRSEICDKFGIDYPHHSLDSEKTQAFEIISENEQNTAIVLNTTRDLALNDEKLPINFGFGTGTNRVYYISDLHLYHKLEHYGAKTVVDIEYIVKKIARDLIKETGEILLIDGDVASDYQVFNLFVKSLREEIDRRKIHKNIIFVLGNHELWDFAGKSFDEIVSIYQELLTANKMYLLQNNILYTDTFSPYQIKEMTTDEISSSSNEEIYEKLRTSRLVFFGGLAFSGYKENFNANVGIYRYTINREQEIEETQKFEKLYNKLLDAVPNKKIIVATHAPMNCWRSLVEYQKGYIYVSGHTHRNSFHDDGEIRIYSDNQIGYYNNYPHMKWFEIDTKYDYFENYADGIYKITPDEYRAFYIGKNMKHTFNREWLYMLKKRGYYCFIYEFVNTSLCILNGGTLKKLPVYDINYYYEHMDRVIDAINKPLAEYTNYQKNISNIIRRIGGDGTIHGCIIDIDFLNHIFVNPFDGTVTPYCALNIIYKQVYPNISELLKAKLPNMYNKYKSMANDNLTRMLNDSNIVASKFESLTIYLETDIYNVSRQIKKMQKLQNNVLTIWEDIGDIQNAICKSENKLLE